MIKNTTIHFPFSAVIGQDRLKNALLLSACDPALGGVLISGNRGTAKSTLARSLADLLDHRPFVNCPLGVSEDRLLGSLDIETVLADGALRFSSGLFSKAHTGVLYVDEINLLPDHLVDLLLDVSASGVNYLERDGISHQHEARFILIGSMNPEEGALRPQLLDRFGLYVDINENPNLQDRLDIVESRLAFDADQEAFVKHYEGRQNAIKQLVQQSKQALKDITASAEIKTDIATRCLQAEVEGVRADLSFYRAARAHAALNGRKWITNDDVDAVEDFVLAHRRQAPKENPPSTSQGEPDNTPSNDQQDVPHAKLPASKDHNSTNQSQGDWGEMPVEAVGIGLSRTLDPSLFSTKHPIPQKKKQT